MLELTQLLLDQLKDSKFLFHSPKAGNLFQIQGHLTNQLVERYCVGNAFNPTISECLKVIFTGLAPDQFYSSTRTTKALSSIIVKAAELADVELLEAIASYVTTMYEIDPIERAMAISVFSLNSTIDDAANSIPVDTPSDTEDRMLTALQTIKDNAVSSL